MACEQTNKRRARVKTYDAPWSWAGFSGNSDVTEEEVAAFSRNRSRLVIASSLMMISDTQPYCDSYRTHSSIVVTQLETHPPTVGVEVSVGASFVRAMPLKMTEDWIRTVVTDMGKHHWQESDVSMQVSWREMR